MPEKTFNEVPRPLREQFDRGMAAYNKNNLDYAITLFSDTLKKEPGFYECREALRAAQLRRGGGGGGLFRKLLGQAAPTLGKAQLMVRSNPAEAMASAEQALNDDPKSTGAHELLARAAMQMDLPRTAVLSLEIAYRSRPGDRGTGMALAEALIAAGQAPRADRIYADLLAANPADAEIAQAYKDLGARRTMHEKGYASLEGGAGSYRDVLANRDEAVTLEQEHRHVKAGDVADRLLAEYEEQFAREPGNLELLRNIAEVQAQKGRLDLALAAYERIVAVEGRSDPSLEKLISDTRLRQFQQRLEALDLTAPDFGEKRAALERERDEYELADCRSRLDQYPTDLGIRFDMGRLYLRAGRVPEAIQELQKAQNHPQRRIAALGLLAQCFARRGMFDLAARTLQNALKEKPVFDDEKKDLTYDLGVVLEKMGKADDAVEQFKLIYETDIGYRDVAARVDAYYASKGM